LWPAGIACALCLDLEGDDQIVVDHLMENIAKGGYDQAQMQMLFDKLDELITALRR
jgi:hypothetical protein